MSQLGVGIAPRVTVPTPLSIRIMGTRLLREQFFNDGARFGEVHLAGVFRL